MEVGQIESLFRYPVKSMAGHELTAAHLGWHGIEGDRRLAVRRINDTTNFPWLSASRLPELLLFTPERHGDEATGGVPTHVRTPDGAVWPVFGQELAADIERRHGAPVQLMQLRHGIFDDAPISVIASDTVREIGKLAGRAVDIRRFRPNIVVRLVRPTAFQEDDWVGGVLTFGGHNDAPAVAVTARDVRCSMVNFDPESAVAAPEILKSIVRVNDNNAGVYGTVTCAGQLKVGQKVILHRR